MKLKPIFYFLVSFLTTGAAMANENMTWGDVLGTKIQPQWDKADHRAFDFWVGEWEMTWRGRQPENFHFDTTGSTTHQRVFPVLDGKAILELAWAVDANDTEPSQRGFSIRYYDEERGRWIMAQNWPNATNDGYAFLDQLIGFRDYRRLSMFSAIRRPQEDGSYQYGHRRYNFSDIGRNEDGLRGFRWDGSNTYDDGATWTTWNVVDAVQVAELDPFGAAGTSWPGYHGGNLCTSEPHGAYDFMEGAWSGTVTRADGSTDSLSMHAGRLLDGCAVAVVVNVDDGRRIFSTLAYVPKEEKWIMFTLDNRPGVGHAYFWSPAAGEGAAFHHGPALSIDNDQELYVQDANFDESAANTRLVWSKVGPGEIVIENQQRTDQDQAWITESTYTFERNQGGSE